MIFKFPKIEVMITLYYIKENIFLYTVEDWITLRKTHRIVGEIVGNSAHIPSLPLKLSPEETLVLIINNVAEVREIMDYESEIDVAELEAKMLEYQIFDYKKNRRIQLENMIDMIVEQRRKLNDNRSKEDILSEELEKTPPVTKENMIWPIFLSHKVLETNSRVINANVINSCTSLLKFQTFKDLHDKGYYITGGAKFGGDFLVYFGDPICHHAIFIVKCVESEQMISTMEVVAFGRLGTSVKKRAVLASIMDEKICYLTINWIDA